MSAIISHDPRKISFALCGATYVSQWVKQTTCSRLIYYYRDLIQSFVDSLLHTYSFRYTVWNDFLFLSVLLVFALSPAWWHSTNTHLPSLSMLGTEPDYFPTPLPLLSNSNWKIRWLNKTLPGAIHLPMISWQVTCAPAIYQNIP